jgi:predicted nucleotidyltransferase
MPPGLTEAQAAAIRAWAERTPCITEVRIFGSRWKGNHGTESDLDLAVKVSDSEGEERGDRFWDHSEGWNADLSAQLGIEVRTICYDPVVQPVAFKYCQESNTVLWLRTDP